MGRTEVNYGEWKRQDQKENRSVELTNNDMKHNANDGAKQTDRPNCQAIEASHALYTHRGP